ncbi:MAG: hypothetical protein R6W90_13135 [Ignavibacteriaceae bacterium]
MRKIKTKREKKTNNKEKIGTILDKDVIQKVKERSIKEGKTISEIIQDAIIKYEKTDPIDISIRGSSKEFLLKTF